MEDERFVVAAGPPGEVDRVAREPDIAVLDRLPVVLLASTSPERSRELSARAGIVVSVYASEPLARLAFDQFRTSRLHASWG